MSIQQRQQQYAALVASRSSDELRLEVTKPPIQLFPHKRYTIVDGELCEAYGQDNILGMSPVTWVRSLTTGAQVPVPINEAPLFDSIGQALLVQQQQGVGGSSSSRR